MAEAVGLCDVAAAGLRHRIGQSVAAAAVDHLTEARGACKPSAGPTPIFLTRVTVTQICNAGNGHTGHMHERTVHPILWPIVPIPDDIPTYV